MIRGAIYRIDLGRGRGHEQGGKRFGVVLSPTSSKLSVATLAPTSRSARAALHRPVITIAGEQTRVLIDQLRSIDTDDVVGEPVDYLTGGALSDVEDALARYLGILPD